MITLSQPVLANKVSINVKAVSQLVKLIVSLYAEIKVVIVVTTESQPEPLVKVMKLVPVSAATQDSAKIVTESLGNKVVIVVITLSQPETAVKLSITVKAVSQLVKLIVSL